jgi:hypothetical protein
LDHGHRYLVIGLLLHYMMMKNESMLVFEHANTQAQLLRHAGLTLADPLGVRFKNGENLLTVWYLLI